jgi:hypothetical protein
MKNQQRFVYWQLYFGLVLVFTGGLFLADQLLGIGLMADYWPLLILLFGLTFFVGMLGVGKKGAGLAIPGSVLVVLGLLLFVQNLFNLWVTWAYAWALLISATGLGMLIMNGYLKREGLRRAAGLIIGIGLAVFVFFGVLFEIILDIAGSDVQSGIFLGVGLILLGLFVVLSPSLFSRRKRDEPALDPDVVDAPFRESEPSPVKSAAEYRSLPEDAQFTSLNFKSVGEVFLLQGDTCDLRVEGNPQLIDKVITQWEGDELKITYNATISDWAGFQWIIAENRLRYYVTVRELHNLTLGGAGMVRADGLTGELLTVNHAGIGKLTLKGLQYHELAVKLGGLGEIHVAGQVDSQVVELTGGGDYNALDLLSQDADVNLSGTGSARVWTESRLNARVSGAGNISYKGEPQVDKTITGLGGVRSL